MVTVNPPGNDALNDECPPGSPCTVPALCPAPVGECNETLSLCPPNEYLRFAGPQMAAHFQNQPGPFPMVDVRHTTYECVDGCGQDPMLGTPGGDLGELMAAAMALMKVTGKTAYNQGIADAVFGVFVNHVATPDRPLYFHSDDASLRRMFVYLDGLVSGGKPSIFPYQGPAGSDGEEWLKALVLPEHNGCGHIRLQLDPTRDEYYSVRVEGTEIKNCDGVTEGCIEAKPLAERIIRNYFSYWWFTKPGSEQRHKVAFGGGGVLVGPLLGKGIAIIKNSPAHVCADHAPLVRPTFGGSKVFVYHPGAVTTWREFVARNALAPLITSRGATVDTFLTAWNNVTNMQLGATLTYLNPANRVGLFEVAVPVKEHHEDSYDHGYHGHNHKY